MRISDWSSDVCSSDLRMFPKSRAARARRALIAAACAALLLAACGSEQAPADTSDATTAPAAAGEVNLYTTREPGLIQPLLDAFTARTVIQVNTGFLQEGPLAPLSADGRNSQAVVPTHMYNGKRLTRVQARPYP